MTDLLTRTATQVRLSTSDIVHQCSRAYTTPDGRRYRTGCGDTLGAIGRPMLTTRAVTCVRCRRAQAGLM